MTRIKKLLALILCAALALSSVPGFTAETAGPAIYYTGPVRTDDTYSIPQSKTGFFEFESSRKNYLHRFDFYYNDEFFSGSAYKYNHNLSKMSLRLAMSAFGVTPKATLTIPHSTETLTVSCCKWVLATMPIMNST